MEDKRPYKYVARAYLEGNKPVQYFVSEAYIKEKKQFFFKNGKEQTCYGIDFIIKFGTENIEDSPTITGNYHGKIFDIPSECQIYVDSINKRIMSENARPFPKAITHTDVLKQQDYIEWVFDNEPKLPKDEEEISL